VTVQIEHLNVHAADGLRFHVARAGSGPPVVLLHGFTGSTETWTELQTELADHFTTIAVDITGHGRSDAPDDPARYSLTRFADDLRDILDALKIPRAVVLGYSMGGRATLRFMIQHPDRVAGAILESTSPGISDEAERTARIAADRSLANRIEANGMESFVDDWERIPLWASLASVPDASRARLREQRLTNSTKGLANSLRAAGAGLGSDALEQLKGIRTSVRLIVGALDAKYVGLGRVMETRIPDTRLRIIDGAGHMAHLEQPEMFRATVVGFLEELTTTNGDWR
jgi:2-succinyl-6-hydroxy-2,4-cyclohexadiene-1-carboxylate synthase